MDVFKISWVQNPALCLMCVFGLHIHRIFVWYLVSGE